MENGTHTKISNVAPTLKYATPKSDGSKTLLSPTKIAFFLDGLSHAIAHFQAAQINQII